MFICRKSYLTTCRHRGGVASWVECEWPPTSKDFLSQIVSITFIFPILILEKEPAFPILMFSAKQGNYWYHFYNVFGMKRSLTGDWTRDLPHSKPTLYHEAIE